MDRNYLKAAGDLTAGIAQLSLELAQPPVVPDAGQIWPDEAAAALNHMATGTLSFTEEEFFSGGSVTFHRAVHRWRGEREDKGHELLKILVRKLEGRHAGVGDSTVEDVSKAFRRAGARTWSVYYVGSMLATRAVSSVAAGAMGFELLLAGLNLRRQGIVAAIISSNRRVGQDCILLAGFQPAFCG